MQNFEQRPLTGFKRIRRRKESAHMLGYSDPLSGPNIEMNTIWEPIIKKVK